MAYARAVFERFTEGARQVVVLAHDEAVRLRHGHVGTEHLLLGLLRKESLAARVLDSFDVTIEEGRAQVARIVGEGDEMRQGEIPFTARATKALELAMREAFALGDDEIAPEHLLLGLAAVPESVAGRILADFEVDAEALRRAVREHRAGAGAPRAPVGRGPTGQTQALFDLEGDVIPPQVVHRSSTPLLVAIVLAAAGFPLGLLAGFLIWG